ncbi:MAG TPA: MBOAT family protein, partial [Catalimonadaceae bacterium]|nr:MBOAT family protein [Catalimonadaceae bacterium]
MLFNSIDFALFLPLVFCLYWAIPSANRRLRNFFLLAASYLFYGWWDWRFLSLLLFSSVLDFSLGALIGATENQTNRKRLLWVSLLTNLGLLGFFKYYNFFIDSLTGAFTFLVQPVEVRHLHIIL